MKEGTGRYLRLEYRSYRVDLIRQRLSRVDAMPSRVDLWSLLAAWYRWPVALRALARWRAASTGAALSACCLDVDCALLGAASLDDWRLTRAEMSAACRRRR